MSTSGGAEPTAGQDLAQVRVQVLGQLGVVVDGRAQKLTKQQRELLALLVAFGPRGASDDRLAEQLWPVDLPATWESSLRNGITKLRRQLGRKDSIENDVRFYRLNLATEEVDAWLLRSLHPQPGSGFDHGGFGYKILLGNPFPDINWGSVLTDAASELEGLARSRLQSVIEHNSQLPEELLTVIEQSAKNNPYDSPFIYSVATALATSGDRPRAVALLDRVEETLKESLNTSLDKELSALRTEYQSAKPLRRAPTLPNPLTQSRRSFPSLLRAAATSALAPSHAACLEDCLQRADLAGADRVWLHLNSERSGEGDEILAHLAWGLYQQDHEVIDLSPGSSAIEVELQRVSGGRPLTVVVQDAHLLDHESESVLSLLFDTDLERQLTILTSGRATSGVGTFGQAGGAARYLAVPVPRIDVDDIDELLRGIAPLWTKDLRRLVASQILATAGGQLEDTRLILQDISQGGEAFQADTYQAAAARMVERLGPLARHIGSCLSVARNDLTEAELADATHLRPEQVNEGLRALLDVGLAVDGRAHASFRIRSATVGDGFESTFSATDLLLLHHAVSATLASRDRSTSDRTSDTPLSNNDITNRLIAIGRGQLDVGAARDAYYTLRQAERLGNELMTADGLSALASAEARLGLFEDFKAHRAEAVKRAEQEANPSAALAAAVAGLPEAELIAGEPERVALLSRIDAEGLSADEQIVHAYHLARQSARLGDHLQVRRMLKRLESLLDGQSGKIELLTLRFIIEPARDGPAKLLEDVRALSLDETVDSRVDSLHAVLNYQVGRVDEADECQERFTARARIEGEPKRLWLAGLFSAMRAFDRGQWPLANALADETAEYGFRYGITEAFDARAAQTVFPYWVTGRLAELKDLFPWEGGDYRNSPTAEIAATAIRFAAGLDPQRCFEDGQRLLRQCHRSRLISTVPATVTLVDLALAAPGDELTDLLIDMLEPLRGTLLALSSGMLNLGPADLHLALLSRDASVANEAIVLADDSNLTLWQIVTRRRIAQSKLEGIDTGLLLEEADLLLRRSALVDASPTFPHWNI